MFIRLYCAQVRGDFRDFPGRPNQPELGIDLSTGRAKFMAVAMLIWTAMVLAGNGLPVAAGVFAIIAGAGLLVAALGLPGSSLPDFRPKPDIDITMLRVPLREYDSGKDRTQP